MNNDDSRGNFNSFQQRKPNPNPHKNPYSPNSTYYGNTGYNNQQHQQHSQHPQQQQRRRPPNKSNFGSSGSSNNNDRLIKQNDIIIALLRDIRDRLPAPPITASSDNKGDVVGGLDLTNENTDVTTDNAETSSIDPAEDNGEYQENEEFSTINADENR